MFSCPEGGRYNFRQLCTTQAHARARAHTHTNTHTIKYLTSCILIPLQILTDRIRFYIWYFCYVFTQY